MEDDGGAEQVMSEVHIGCPPRLSAPHISNFTFPLLPTGNYHGRIQAKASSSGTLCLDKDGDLNLVRRNERIVNCGLAIQHSITSSLSSVGLQVWRAALVLADFILHESCTSFQFNGSTAIELGAGTGLVSIILARVARTIFVTDIGYEVLDNCATNAHLNSGLLKLHESPLHVRELNWKESWPPDTLTFNPPSLLRYSWSSSEIEEAERATLLLAADVIYSDELTNAFFGVLEKLMARGSKKVLYMALEKRYNFTLDDLHVVANGYAHFRSFLKVDDEGLDDKLLPRFVGKQMDIDEVPQYIREYERGKDLELWRITYHSD